MTGSGWTMYRLFYTCTPHLLGNLLGMAALFHSIHTLYGKHRICIFYIYRLRHRVDMEQQLANIKLRFFTDISHELRTPLTLISSPVTEVLENEPLSPSAREHLTLVHQNTERMLRLMNQILDFRKIQNQKMKLLIEETDLIPLLQKVMSSFKLIAEEKNINYQLTSTIQSVYSWVDRDKFEKIFFNLLSNAFKYTPADKSITVNITTKEKTVEKRLQTKESELQ